jgi:hypothetical protein
MTSFDVATLMRQQRETDALCVAEQHQHIRRWLQVRIVQVASRGKSSFTVRYSNLGPWPDDVLALLQHEGYAIEHYQSTCCFGCVCGDPMVRITLPTPAPAALATTLATTDTAQ